MRLIDRLISDPVRRAVEAAMVTKAISPKDPTLRRIFGWDDEKKDLTRPYTQLPVVYACVSAIAHAVAQVPFVISRSGAGTASANDRAARALGLPGAAAKYLILAKAASGTPIPPTHPAARLFAAPNPYLSPWQLWEACVINVELSGEAFVAKDPASRDGVPVALWLLPPEDIKERLDDAGRLLGWDWHTSKGTVSIAASMMIQPKLFNPYNAIRGLAPLRALEITNDSMWSAMRLNREAFKRDIAPGTIFTTDQTLTEAQYERMHHELVASRQGLEHAGEALLLEAGLKAGNARLANKDMQFLELLGYSREDVMMVFKVPKAELSMDDQVNRASSYSSSLIFMKKTVMPTAAMLAHIFNVGLLNGIGLEGRFDFSGVDILVNELEAKANAVTAYHKVGVPFDLINERMELGFPEFEGSDQPFGGQPQGPAVPPPPADGEEEPAPPAKRQKAGFDLDNALARYRDEIWKRATAPVFAQQARFTAWLRTYFGKGAARARRTIQGVDDVDRVWEDVLPAAELRAGAERYIGAAIEIGAERAPRRRKRFEDDELLRGILQRRTVQITTIAETVRQELTDAIRAMIAEAGDEGWTEDQRLERVAEIIGDQFDGASNRARTIARTELHGAFAEGEFVTLDAMDDQPTHKEWITSRDALVRDEHDIDGEIVEWGEVFSNGLQYPMDPAGAAENVINCRCVMNPIWGGKAYHGDKRKRIVVRRTMTVRRDEDGALLGATVEDVEEEA